MINAQAVPKSIVITGGEGFVGKYLQAELAHAWPKTQVVSWDLPQVDITKPDTYWDRLKQTQPEWVVHLAAIASVPAALKDPDITRRVNVDGASSLFEAIQRSSRNTKVLFISTSDVYGEAARDFGSTLIPELPLASARPVNPYAESKRDAEKLIEDQYNERCIRVRPFPHIGPGQGLGFVTADFASQIAAIESGKKAPVMKVGNLGAKRDFCDVRDVVRAYCLLMERATPGEVYHVASGQAVSIHTILNMLLELSTSEITIEADTDRMRPSDTPVLAGDAGKLNSETGWKPTIPLAQSLADILNYWRSA